MAPECVTNNLLNLPGRSRIYKDPLGLVCIIGAWNYPVQVYGTVVLQKGSYI